MTKAPPSGSLVALKPDPDCDGEGAEEDAGERGEEDSVHAKREGRPSPPPSGSAQAGVLTRSGTLSR